MQPSQLPLSVPDPPGQKADDSLHIEAVWESAYEQIVRPERAVVLNAYFIRHLGQLGPDLGWMYIAFRQAAYSAGGRDGLRAARFSGKAIAGLSGSTERTFWNRAGRPETWERLAGLVTRLEEGPLWDSSSPTPKRIARKYAVAMTLPLTGPDTHALRSWLEQHRAEYPGALELLQAAIAAPLAELLAPSGGVETPLAVHRLVREMFSGQAPDRDLNALAERLHQHIQPSTDLLFLTLFFVEHILPQIGAGPGWLLSILRDRCWVNPQSGETRSQVTVKGGYAEMAGWLGLSRPMTIYEWLREPVLQVYLHERRNQENPVGLGEASKWHLSRAFDVLMEEVPAELVQLALSGVDPVTHFSVSGTADFSIGVTRFSVSGYANFSMAVTQISQFSGAIFRVFKLLSSLKLLKQMAPPEKPPEAPKELGADAPVCDLENPKPEETVEEPRTPKAQDAAPEAEQEPRVAAFPEDVRQAAEIFSEKFGLLLPAQPAPGEKGGDFALWIKGLRKLNQIAADYGVAIEKAIQATHEYWNNRPFTVSHPLAIKSTMQSVLSRKNITQKPAQPAATATASYDPAQRRKEISSALGFDIDQPLTAEQQAALQAHLDSLLAQLPKNPLKS